MRQPSKLLLMRLSPRCGAQTRWGSLCKDRRRREDAVADFTAARRAAARLKAPAMATIATACGRGSIKSSFAACGTSAPSPELKNPVEDVTTIRHSPAKDYNRKQHLLRGEEMRCH